ncbi:g6f-like [Anabas testudineus]|uniref:Ig-like domain-containing protein n=1 Tax=Anabas testudineus TaxID=64144 RepID=A0A3Q1JDZ5_ANATE|nr:g6f-like [Anabas testudineus]
MESCFLTIIIISSFVVYCCRCGIPDWDDVVVAREDMPTTMVCTDTPGNGVVAINWRIKSLRADEWKLILSAKETERFSGGALKPSMRLTDPNFHDTGVFSLFLLPKLEDSGLYSCLMIQRDKPLKERKILLAILTVTVIPTAPIPQHSTLRLIASVNPDYAITKITWTAPGGIYMKSEKMPNTGTVAKLPKVQNNDNGVYVCTLHLWGNSSSSFVTFNVDVTIDAHKVASFTNITHATQISSATQAQTSFHLTCPAVQGDHLLLYWRPPNINNNKNMKIVYEYDRWRGSTLLTEQSKRLQLAGPPYNAEAGSFSFLLTPEIRDAGLYICDVYLNDVVFSQRTLLSVLKVKTRHFSSKLELLCKYSELGQVKSASWEYQNKSRQLHMTNSPGSITTTVPLPITDDTAGNYTCTLKLKNGQTIWATYVVTVPSEESVSATTSSLFPSLSALLLLVPLVAVSVGVLLWRQKHISDHGIEQSLSVHSGEAENIYENPVDFRQAPPQGSVYMDLKPRGEDDVYKELERYEQCQN